jgi:hypothetical protein
MGLETDLSRWREHGVSLGASHLIIAAYGRYTEHRYPLYVWPGDAQDADEVAARYRGAGQKIVGTWPLGDGDG